MVGGVIMLEKLNIANIRYLRDTHVSIIDFHGNEVIEEVSEEVTQKQKALVDFGWRGNHLDERISGTILVEFEGAFGQVEARNEVLKFLKGGEDDAE